MKSAYIADMRRRALCQYFERKRLILRSLRDNVRLSPLFRLYALKSLRTLPRDASITRVRNRCVLTSRSRSIYRSFGISRLMFRKLALQSQLIGVTRASW